MNESEKMSEWIDRYNSGDLQEPELTVFRKMLEVDPVLRVHVSIDRSVNEMLKNDDLLQFIEKVRQIDAQPEKSRGRRNYWLVAASVLLLLSAGIITLCFDQVGLHIPGISGIINKRPSSAPLCLSFYLLNQSRIHQNITPVARREILQNNYLAASFKPIAEYELLVGSVTRCENFRMQSPQTRLSIPRGGVVHFKWNAGSAWYPLTLELLDNKGFVILPPLLMQGNSCQLSTEDIEPGIFYWRIMSDDGLLMMGSLILF
jgi:hypothetical protein